MYRKWRSLRHIFERTSILKMSMDLTSCFHSMLLDITEATSPQIESLEKEDIEVLLRNHEAIVDEHPRATIVGYPTYPLYREIATLLQSWANSGHCPILDLPSYDLLDEKSYVEKRAEMIANVTVELRNIQSLWETMNETEQKQKLREIIQILGKRGLLDLLGIRKTTGTIDVWPPPRKVLESTFNALHKPESASLLTVGARAFTKHCNRDTTLTFWGKNTGNEAQKNDHASDIMYKILDNAMWINTHTLPHEVYVIEARNEQGYGMRWTTDGKQFRGFLEPQMVDGHEVGWKH